MPVVRFSVTSLSMELMFSFVLANAFSLLPPHSIPLLIGINNLSHETFVMHRTSWIDTWLRQMAGLPLLVVHILRAHALLAGFATSQVCNLRR